MSSKTKSESMPYLRLLLLMTVFCVLLLAVWLTDTPSPAEPGGRLSGLLLLAIILIGSSLTLILLVRAIQHIKHSR